MSNINDLPSLRANHKDLNRDLKEVFAKYGLTFMGNNAKIGMGECNFNIKTKYGSAEDQIEEDRKTYQVYHRMLDLPENGFNRVLKFSDGKSYKIVGVQPSKPKNCVKLIRVSDGKSFQCSSEMIQGAITREELTKKATVNRLATELKSKA